VPLRKNRNNGKKPNGIAATGDQPVRVEASAPTGNGLSVFELYFPTRPEHAHRQSASSKPAPKSTTSSLTPRADRATPSTAISTSSADLKACRPRRQRA